MVIFFHITAALYLLATFVSFGFLVSHKEKLSKVADYTLIGAFVCHTLTVIGRWVQTGQMLGTTFHESITIFAWLIVLVYFAGFYRYKLPVLGAFVAPFSLILIITASLLPKEIIPLAPIFESYWLPAHIVLAFLGNAFFAVAFLLGIMYIIQERHLKRHNFTGLYFILPSLEVSDELNYKCLQYGFPLLTLGIITGAIWSEYAIGTYWTWAPRQIWSLITWFLYSALLHGRLTSGWRGRKAALFSSFAFLVLIGSFFVLNVLLGSGHGLTEMGQAETP